MAIDRVSGIRFASTTKRSKDYGASSSWNIGPLGKHMNYDASALNWNGNIVTVKRRQGDGNWLSYKPPANELEKSRLALSELKPGDILHVSTTGPTASGVFLKYEAKRLNEIPEAEVTALPRLPEDVVYDEEKGRLTWPQEKYTVSSPAGSELIMEGGFATAVTVSGAHLTADFPALRNFAIYDLTVSVKEGREPDLNVKVNPDGNRVRVTVQEVSLEN